MVIAVRMGRLGACSSSASASASLASAPSSTSSSCASGVLSMSAMLKSILISSLPYLRLRATSSAPALSSIVQTPFDVNAFRKSGSVDLSVLFCSYSSSDCSLAARVSSPVQPDSIGRFDGYQRALRTWSIPPTTGSAADASRHTFTDSRTGKVYASWGDNSGRPTNGGSCN